MNVVTDSEGVKSRIGYMPQRSALYSDLTIDENIRFYADLLEVASAVRPERATRLLKAPGMSAFGRFKAGQLPVA